MADTYAAFISYAHRDKAWVQALQENLERCLAAAGRPGKVFLDEVDLASGRSWVGQLQAGLDRSEQLILVATPEALASPRVADEWKSFVAGRADWHDGRLHIVHLADVPLPPFLGQIQFVDFRKADEDRYRKELRKLAAGLLGRIDGRDLPVLPAGIEIPRPPAGRLDPALRSAARMPVIPKALVQENPPLGLRALATAQSLRPETVREVLALSEQWKERAEVYRRLPELIGEPRRALALIDQLRRQTRSGNDLYFLDTATREVGRLSRDHAAEASALLTRFFDHIPKPPEELFRWIETPLNGRVPLWREIPAGSFWMGSPEGEGDKDEHPRHQVTVTSPFLCGAVPVTNVQYAAFDPGHEPFGFEGIPPEELPFHPVESITWFEAVSFCRWLATSFPWARAARLPTEEEWEYACRAGSQGRYWSGEEEKDLAEVGWYDANSSRRTHRAGEKPANPWGLYDVHGNVWEWTLSPWTGSYEGRAGGVSVDPAGVEVPSGEAPGGVWRVMRGGSSWDDAGWARAAYRDNGYPVFGNGGQGFRVVLPAGPELLAMDRRS